MDDSTRARACRVLIRLLRLNERFLRAAYDRLVEAERQ